MPRDSGMDATLLWASFTSILAIVPLAVVLGGLGSAGWMRVAVEFGPLHQVEAAALFPALGSLLGSWVGALALPLDWGRWWIVWPIPCVYGAILGYGIGCACGMGAVLCLEPLTTAARKTR